MKRTKLIQTRTEQDRDFLANIGFNITQARIERCLTQADLAKILESPRSRQCINMIENGHKDISVLTLKMLADAMGLPIGVLLKDS
jgi:DNA-binding XRE family transcriptional regulator